MKDDLILISCIIWANELAGESNPKLPKPLTSDLNPEIKGEVTKFTHIPEGTREFIQELIWKTPIIQ